MAKYNILVIPSDKTGVSYFRSTKPHIKLEEKYPDLFHIDIDYEPRLDDDEYLKKYDIIHYHRTIGDYEKVEEVLNRCDKLGIKTIMDLDDWYEVGPHHPAYHLVKNIQLDKKILANIRSARYLSVTTPIFRQEALRFNKNIVVFPNTIDPEEDQYKIKNVAKEDDRIRIGYLGGSSHEYDLEPLRDNVKKLHGEKLMDFIRFYICGYDLRGQVTMIDQKTKEQKQRAIQPKESVWYKYEQIFTNNFTTVSPQYKEWLMRFEKNGSYDYTNEPYSRVWTKPISTYATNYNNFDIALAPIEENIFNKVKSQLKVIESGFFKKALIAQNYGPYKIDCINAWEKGAWNPKGNALLVDSSKNHKQWYEHIKRLINNPNAIIDLSEKLYETVKDKYHIDTITAQRKDFYISLINDDVDNYMRNYDLSPLKNLILT
jgi:hypothetical protein